MKALTGPGEPMPYRHRSRFHPLFAVGAIGLFACTGPAAQELDVSSQAEDIPAVNGSTGAGGAGASGGSSAGSGGAGGASGGAGPDCPGAVEPVSGEADLLTWNLEQYPLTAATEAKTQDLIRELQPEIIAVQEIGDVAAFHRLVDGLDGYAGILNEDPGAYYHVGLIYRRGRVVLNSVETLFESDWWAFPRPPLAVHLTIEDAEHPIDFYVVVLHLKAMLDGESQERREDACERLEAWVTERQAAGPEQDFILLGDFNDQLTDPPPDNVYDAFLSQPERFSFLTLPLEEAGEHTYIPFESMIDHVLITNDALGEVGAGYAEVLPLDETTADYDAITDHRPVRTRLIW